MPISVGDLIIPVERLKRCEIGCELPRGPDRMDGERRGGSLLSGERRGEENDGCDGEGGAHRSEKHDGT